MPWTTDDVDDFREGLTEAQKEEWVAIANGVLESCIEDEGEQGECEERAIRIANSEFEKEASVLDFDRLEEHYIVIGLDGQPGWREVDDVREQDADFGDGVHALWSDGLQSLIAFAFAKSQYTQEEAEEWVAKATEESEGMNIMDVVRVTASALGEQLARSLGLRQEGGGDRATESWDETRRKIEGALNDAYQLEAPWIMDIGPERAIVDMDGGYWSISYTVSDSGEVELSEPKPASQAWIDENGTPITLMAFSSKLQSGDEAEPDEDDGLVWKEIIHPGQWHKMDSGRVVEITADIIKAAYEAFKAGLPKFVSVPAGSYHPQSVAAEDNRGFVADLKLIGNRLFGGFKFTNPDTRSAVEDGSIADCSVYLEPEVVHPETGEKFPWALTHVLLTNNPLVQDLGPFGEPIPASAGGNVTVDVYVQSDEEEAPMSDENTDITLSAEDQSLLDSLKARGLTADDIEAMVAERERVKEKNRDLEITQIVRALEAQETHDLVAQVDGTRHWPVVVAAAERALREQPQALALDVEDGRSALDEVILDVVNAIPADARMQVGEQPRGSKDPEDPTLEADDEDSVEVKEAKAKALTESLTPRKGSAVGIG
jgi:hypothetical protein